jgi:hypothetical protein
MSLFLLKIIVIVAGQRDVVVQYPRKFHGAMHVQSCQITSRVYVIILFRKTPEPPTICYLDIFS